MKTNRSHRIQNSDTTQQLGALPPNSVECEQSVLSGVLLDESGQAFSIAQQCGVRPGAFYEARHRVVFEQLQKIYARGTPIDLAVLVEELKVTNQLEAAGGLDYLMEVSSRVPTTAQLRFHAEQAVLLWQLRHALVLTQELREAVWNFEDRDAFSAVAGEVGQRLIRLGRREAARTLGEQVATVRDDVMKRGLGEEDKGGWVTTGLPSFDEKCRPLGSAREDQLVAVAGGSGMGKSALLRQMADAALESGKRVLVYTRETSIEGFVEQLVASRCSVDLLHPRSNIRERLNKFSEECDRLIASVVNKRLWLVQHEPATPLMYIEDLEAHYRAFSHLHGHPHLVVVDYLQLFMPRKRCNNREQEVAQVSHTLQALCRASGSVWAVGVQMNEAGLREQRQVRRDEEGRLIHRLPNAGDLRESQAIFHDADRVLAIYRPPVDCREQDQSGPGVSRPEQWICQIKRRKGGTGFVKCWFEARFTRFVELSAGDALMDTSSKVVPEGGLSKSEWKKRQKPGGES